MGFLGKLFGKEEEAKAATSAPVAVHEVAQAQSIRVRPSYDTFSNQGNSCLAKLSWNPFKNHIVN